MKSKLRLWAVHEGVMALELDFSLRLAYQRTYWVIAWLFLSKQNAWSRFLWHPPT